MRLLIASELRCTQGSDGKTYADGPAKYAFWANYLEAFDEVRILARVASEPKQGSDDERVDGPSVSFLPLPDYHGPWEYLLNLPELRRRVRQAVDECDAYLLRVPGLVGGLVWRELRKRGKTYALEVVGDPWDVFGPGTWPSIFRPAFRHFGTRELKTMCSEASAVHYVTQSALQQRYPAGPNAYSVGFSDALMDGAFVTAEKMDERLGRIDELAAIGSCKSNVEAELSGAEAPSSSSARFRSAKGALLPGLKSGASTQEQLQTRHSKRAVLPRINAGAPPLRSSVIADVSRAATDDRKTDEEGREARLSGQARQPAAAPRSANRFRVGFVGTFSQMYKGPDILLRAIATCNAQGLDLEAALAGEGRCIDAMKSLATELRISDRVQFLGQLPAGKPVFAFLDSIDLFLMPSRQEGLPRALLEAMARGCPCVGSNVGGIPELLDAAEMVLVGDAKALAGKIMEVAADGERMKRMAMRNLEKARKYSPELLRDARREFCRMVRVRAEEGREG